MLIFLTQLDCYEEARVTLPLVLLYMQSLYQGEYPDVDSSLLS